MNHPLQPLTPMQRLGWLQHFTRIRCTQKFASFVPGQSYPVTTSTAAVNHSETRLQRDGMPAAVILTGWDLLVKISATPIENRKSKIENSEVHRFLARPQSIHPWIHDLSFLIAHFAIPEILDLAALNSAAFRNYQEKLRALES